jgi:hypothetical protein
MTTGCSGDLDRAVIFDIHDAAARRLPFGEVDEDGFAWPQPGSGSSTSTRIRPRRGKVQGRRPADE